MPSHRHFAEWTGTPMTFQPGRLAREKCNRGDAKDLQNGANQSREPPRMTEELKKIMVHGFQGRSNRVDFRAPRVGVGLLRRQMASVIGFVLWIFTCCCTPLNERPGRDYGIPMHGIHGIVQRDIDVQLDNGR